MARIKSGMLFFALLIASGCERHAGTEVGNPELTVAARFGIHNTDATVTMRDLALKLMGMGWTMGKDSGTCWNEPEGHMMDFAGFDQGLALPIVTVRNGDWSQAELMLQSPGGDSSQPVTHSFANWSNPRYAKFIKVMGADTVRVLFEMPREMRIKLMFAKATIASWRTKDRIDAKVMFDIGKWAGGLGVDPNAFFYRRDRDSVPYVMLSPRENILAYEAMKASLPLAFMADAADML